MTESMQRYLAAKRTVDDRAINRRVWDCFVSALEDRARGRNDGTVRIVEVGAGVGAMVARLAAWNVPAERVVYRAVDHDRHSVAYARERLPAWLEAAGYAVERTGEGLTATRDQNDCAPGGSRPRRIDVSLEVANAFEIDDEADALIAAAFLDIVGLDGPLEAFRTLLADGGLLYAPITFDGGTAFSPPEPVDDRIERLYHRHMDDLRTEPGGSRTGRELLPALPDAGYDVLAAGGADWIVRPRDGGYPAEEDVFLAELLSTIEGALADYPEDELDPSVRRRWVETRRGQLDRAELYLVAHHLDVLARVRER